VCGWLLVSGLVALSDDRLSSVRGIRREVGEYVANVYRYHRQYIYDVVLYQYWQDQLAATESNNHFSNVLMDILSDAQQVFNIGYPAWGRDISPPLSQKRILPRRSLLYGQMHIIKML